MSEAPLVGVTGPDRGGYSAWLFTSWAVRSAGGIPVRVTPSSQLPGELDALIVGGGSDVAPERYGGQRMPKPERGPSSRLEHAAGYVIAPLVGLLRRTLGRSAGARVQPEGHARDDLELGLLDTAHVRGWPVLGICRGAQLLNVHAGGTLFQDLRNFYTERPNPWTVFPAKTVQVSEDSHLRAALGASRCDVNSLHLQAIDKLGQQLRVVARDESGVVQAVEAPNRPFWIGVQWHPEYMPQLRPQRRLFQWLIRAAVRLRRGSESTPPPSVHPVPG